MGATDEFDYMKEVSPNAGLKILQVWTKDADENDYADIDIEKAGINKVFNVLCQVHTTDNAVIATEVATTSIESDKLRVTFPSSNDGKKRSILVFGQ